MEQMDLVAQFIACTSWSGLPEAVRRKARMALLDVLGCILVGTRAPVSQITARFAADTWPGAEASILGQGLQATACGAAFANGYAANALDLDDCAKYTRGHPGAQIVPTALALAEATGRSGAEMVAAIVVGYEIAHRAARIWHAAHTTFQACASWGSVACAAVAAHVLGLSPEQTKQALGIAEYYAPNVPMMWDVDHPSMAKHGIGWGAMTGIMAAQLAQRGFTGVPSLFGLPSYADWVNDLGSHFVMEDGVVWKRYACCAWTHAAVLAAKQLMQASGFHPDDIARLRIEGFHEAIRLGARVPQTTEEAQFNMAWPVAAMLVYGEVGPDQVLDTGLQDDRVQRLVKKTELVESATLNDLYALAVKGDPRGRYASAVTIVLNDGTRLESGVVEGEINYPCRGWDEQGLERKFRWLVRQVLDGATTERALDAVWQVDHLPRVSVLTELVSSCRRSV
jgi:2-methylcitrate dehydratase PrpD